MPLADYASHPKYPWRCLQVGAAFSVPFSEVEKLYSKVATRRRKSLCALAHRMRRYNLYFSIARAKDGVIITRVR